MSLLVGLGYPFSLGAVYIMGLKKTSASLYCLLLLPRPSLCTGSFPPRGRLYLYGHSIISRRPSVVLGSNLEIPYLGCTAMS